MNLFLSQAVLPLQAAGLDLYVVAAGGVRERMDEEAVDNARRVAQQQALLWQQRNLPPKPAKGSDTEHVGRAQGQGRHRSAVGDGGAREKHVNLRGRDCGRDCGREKVREGMFRYCYPKSSCNEH